MPRIFYSPGRKYGGPGKFAFDKNEQIELHKLCEYEKMRKKFYLVGEGSLLVNQESLSKNLPQT